MVFKKGDFIEIEFTGRVRNGEIFDSNIKEDLKALNSNFEAKPLVFCLKKGMFMDSIDDFLIGKDIGEYEVELPPEKAFGTRNPKLIQTIPVRIFKQNNINPVPGALLNLDGRLAKVLTVSGGRIMVDFNNPLAGKIVVYKLKAIRKVDDINEKVKSLISFFFKKDIDFEIKDKQLLLQVEKPLAEYVKVFEGNFKDILGLGLEVREIENAKEKKTDEISEEKA